MDVSGRGLPTGRDAIASLRSRSFPARVRQLLEILLTDLSPFLHQGLVQSLDHYEDALFKRAEQARSNLEQQRYFETMREIRRVRADISPLMVAHFEAALASLGDARRQSSLSRAERAQRTELSLVETGELEESLALVDVANRAELRHSQTLFALGLRFAVLAEAPTFEPEDLPIGPHRLGECLRKAIARLDVPTEHRVLLIRHVDHALFGRLESFFEAANRVFIENQILPHLLLAQSRTRRDEDDAPAAAAPVSSAPPSTTPADGQGASRLAELMEQLRAAQKAAASAASGPAATAPPATAAAAPIAPGPAAPAASAPADSQVAPARATQQRFGLPLQDPAGMSPQGAYARPMTGWLGVPRAEGSDRAMPAAAAPAPTAFGELRELLGARRAELGLPQRPPPDEKSHFVAPGHVQQALSALQEKPPTPLSVGGRLVPRSVQHVKQDVLNQLRQVTPEGQLPRIPEEDADTMDLVGLLFDKVLKETPGNSTVTQMMTRLQVPVLRAALADKSFFAERDHPARQLINAVAETSLYWFGEGEDDRQLAEKMQGTVDRVVHEFQGDPKVFTEAAGDLGKHLQLQARKSDVAERRHVDAARGRERLDGARHTASDAIAQRLADRKPRALVRTMLEQAWSDVLALTILRNGEDSDLYRQRLAVVDDLLAYGSNEPAAVAPAAVARLRDAVDQGLGQVGFHAEDVAAVTDRLFGQRSGPVDADDPATLTEVAARLKAHSRFGEEGDGHGHHHSPHRAQVDPPLNEAERAELVRLRSLPFGTWFELRMAPMAEPLRRKLSWFSPTTGRCFFVNQRGAKTHEATLEQLARDVSQGLARVQEANSEGLIDRAFGAIMRTLRVLSGQGEGSSHA